MKNKYKVLLVSMSGVRVYNKRLLDLGLTLPGFVERSKVIASLPSLGLLTLAGYTPENWEIQYLEIDAISEILLSYICITFYTNFALLCRWNNLKIGCKKK